MSQDAQLFDETALVERARGGDDGAFAELVNQYDRRVYRVARQITQSDEDSEDVLQEAFLKAYTNLDRFEGNSKFYTWLTRIVVNEALMKLRKRKSDRTVSLDQELDTGEDTLVREVAVWEGNPEDQFGESELKGILDEAISNLKDSFRTVFVLRDIEGLSTEETAASLDISEAAVKSRLLRARLALRERLTKLFKRKGEDILAYL